MLEVWGQVEKVNWICCCVLVAKSCLILLWPDGLQPTRLLCPWNFPGKNTGVGCHAILQGIYLTQGSNPCLLHWQADSLPLSHQGSPYGGIEMDIIPLQGEHSKLLFPVSSLGTQAWWYKMDKTVYYCLVNLYRMSTYQPFTSGIFAEATSVWGLCMRVDMTHFRLSHQALPSSLAQEMGSLV